MSDHYWIDGNGTRRRNCCDSTYDCTHFDDCPEWGIEARAAKPCVIVPLDGWCETHSIARGPAYCATPASSAPATESGQA